METIFNELAREMKEDTRESIGKLANDVGFMLGTITSTGLSLDSYKTEIKDYMTLDYLNLEDSYKTESAGEHTHNHNVNIPKQLKSLRQGDRVLVTTVGNEYIVVGRVV